MKLSILAGSTSQSVTIFVNDSSSTTGAGLTGLAYNTSSLVAYYTFNGTSATATAITLATLSAVNSAFSSGGFKEISSSNMPGVYRLDIPDAALAAASGRSVVIMLKGATNMAPCVLEVELTAWNNQDGVRGGMTALPNAAAEAGGGLYTRGTGAGQINQDANGRIDANVKTWIGGAIPAVTTTGVPLVDTKYVTGTLQTARDLGTSVLLSVGTGTGQVNLSSGKVPATIAAGDLAADSVDASALKADAATEIATAVRDINNTSPASSSLGAAVNSAASAGDPWNTSIPGAYASGKAGYILGTNLDALVSSRLASGSYTAPSNSDIAAIKAKTDNLPSDPADASDIAGAFSTVNSTLATIAGYIDTEVAAIKAKTDNLPSDPADASDIAASFSTVNSTLSTIAGYIDTEVAAIKAKTDNLPSDPADESMLEALITANSPNWYSFKLKPAFTTTAGVEVRLTGLVEYRGQRFDVHGADATATCALAVREHGAGSDLFTISATTVNANGTFELSQALPGFTADRLYRYTATVVINAVTYTFEDAYPNQG